MITILMTDQMTVQAWVGAIVEVAGVLSAIILSIINALKTKSNTENARINLAKLQEQRNQTLKDLVIMFNTKSDDMSKSVAKRRIQNREGIHLD